MDQPGFSRETRIRRDRFGQWFEGDEPVTNAQVAAAFDRWIDRAPDGRYCLKNSVNWAYVEIEGAPIFVRSAVILEDGIDLELSDYNTERLDPATLSRDEEGRLLCTVRSGSMPAELTSQAMMNLEPIIAEDEQGIYLTIASRQIRPQLKSSSTMSQEDGKGGKPKE